MKLKKYVRFKNGDVKIRGFHKIEKDEEKDIVQESNSVLSLAKVGDLIETDQGMMNIEEIKSNHTLFILCRDIVEIKEINAIWFLKEGSNKDSEYYSIMKRFSV
jgi:hypothetical protein